MGLSRRSFLGFFGLAASGLFVSTKAIFLPPTGGWLPGKSAGLLKYDMAAFINTDKFRIVKGVKDWTQPTVREHIEGVVCWEQLLILIP